MALVSDDESHRHVVFSVYNIGEPLLLMMA